MAAVVRSLEELLAQTVLARQDPYLAHFVVNGAMSHEEVEGRAHANDYHTNMCRQAKLLFDIRMHYPETYQQLCAANPSIFKDGRRYDTYREFPCTWETSSQDEMQEGREGILVVERTTEKPALFWDYTLLDADRRPVCHSKDMGKDTWFEDNRLVRVISCYLNYGSRSLPKRETVISFRNEPAEFKVERDGTWGKVTWCRRIVGKKEERVEIIRTLIPSDPTDEMQTAVISSCTPDEREALQKTGATPHENPWKLSLATHIIKLDQGLQGAVHSDVRLYYTFTTTYLFSLETCFARDRSWRQNAERKPGRGISIDMSIVDANQGIHVSSKLQPNKLRTTEEIIASIDRSTPLQIKAKETIERMCDLRRLYGYVYGSPDERDVPMNMLVPFVPHKK